MASTIVAMDVESGRDLSRSSDRPDAIGSSSMDATDDDQKSGMVPRSPSSPHRLAIIGEQTTWYSCGLSLNTFIAVVILTIVGAAMGAALGYAIINGSKNNSNDQSAAAGASCSTPASNALDISTWITDQSRAAFFRSQFLQQVSNTSIRNNTVMYASKPHMAGSAQNNMLATETYNRYVSYGFDDVRVDEYPVLLAELYDRSVNVTLANGTVIPLPLDEPNILNETDYGNALPPSNGYSGTGYAEGPVVWANYGRQEDFDALANVSLVGTIVVVRYGMIFRGNKAQIAQARGAIGVLIVMDPADVGYTRGAVLPDGPWATNYTVQRGSVFVGRADPRTPTWPSETDGPVLAGAQLTDPVTMDNEPLPIIPIQPLGIAAAMLILSNVGGPTSMPAAWSGTTAFPIGNFVGPSTGFRVAMRVTRELKVKTIYNVVATMTGAVEPDRVVLLGSHRDAWSYGAVDPISGHSVTLEIGRSLGALRSLGYRPRRSIQLCSWDGEEWGITGSIEYMEKVVSLMRARAVAYINLDTAVTGRDFFGFGGSPSFWPLLQELIPMFNLPEGGPLTPKAATSIEPVGSGSDFVGFIQLAGVPILDPGFGATDGRYEAVYHSNYDSIYWADHFDDPGYYYHQLVARFVGTVVMRLADDTIIPLSLPSYSQHVQRWIQDYTGSVVTGPLADFSYLTAAGSILLQRTTQFDNTVTIPAKAGIALLINQSTGALNGTVPAPMLLTSLPATVGSASSLWLAAGPNAIRRLNDNIMGFERVFLGWGRLESGQAWYKHVLFTPSAVNSYGSVVMPIIHDALYAVPYSRSTAEFQIGRIAQFIRRGAYYLDTVAVVPSNASIGVTTV